MARGLQGREARPPRRTPLAVTLDTLQLAGVRPGLWPQSSPSVACLLCLPMALAHLCHSPYHQPPPDWTVDTCRGAAEPGSWMHPQHCGRIYHCPWCPQAGHCPPDHPSASEALRAAGRGTAGGGEANGPQEPAGRLAEASPPRLPGPGVSKREHAGLDVQGGAGPIDLEVHGEAREAVMSASSLKRPMRAGAGVGLGCEALSVHPAGAVEP